MASGRYSFNGWKGGDRELTRATITFLFLVYAFLAVGQSNVVVSQIYGGGGNSGAPFRADFIELFNRGPDSADLTGWSVQYASSASAGWQSLALDGELQAGQYYLLQLASGGTNGAALPASDGAGNLNLAAGSGKVALVRSLDVLTGTCPSSDAIADLVGYGGPVNCQEGTGAAPSPSNTTAAFRASEGCFDSNQNGADFYVARPAPRNRASARNVCPAQSGPLPLHAIQGSNGPSSWTGWFVTTTTNVVVAIQDEGFHMQTRETETDGRPETSEGLFVLTPFGLPPAAALGNEVVVSGIVVQAGRPNHPARTQILNATVTLIGSGRPRPAPVLLTPSLLSPTGHVDQLEQLESMRVQVDSLTVVSATEGFVIENSAIGVSDGVFYGVLAGTARPFREPGIPILEALPAGAPAAVPRFDQNPELLRVDSNTQPGTTRIEVRAGATIGNLVGILTFESEAWTLLPEAGVAPNVSGNGAATALPTAASNEFTVASFNLERFFDTADDPLTDDVVLTAAAFEGRLNKASLAIRGILQSPDILGVVEIENLPILEALATKLNTDTAASGSGNPGYRAWLKEGNDIGGIDIGYLIKTTRVDVVDVVQVGKESTFLNPLTGQSEILNDRPPLILRAEIRRSASTNSLPVTVIANHLRSMSEIDDPVEGIRIRAKRRAQAEFLADLAQQQQQNDSGRGLIVLGDFNAFQFNDGYADLVGTIRGAPPEPNAVVLPSPDLVEPNLVNLTDEAPADQRYSFCFGGNAQALDHILINQVLRPRHTRFVFGRSNADFPTSLRGNFNRPERLTDHDAPVAYFRAEATVRLTAIHLLEPGQVRLEWESDPGERVEVESSSDLIEWSFLGSAFTTATGAGSFTNAAAAGQRFYRLFVP